MLVHPLCQCISVGRFEMAAPRQPIRSRVNVIASAHLPAIQPKLPCHSSLPECRASIREWEPIQPNSPATMQAKSTLRFATLILAPSVVLPACRQQFRSRCGVAAYFFPSSTRLEPHYSPELQHRCPDPGPSPPDRLDGWSRCVLTAGSPILIVVALLAMERTKPLARR